MHCENEYLRCLLMFPDAPCDFHPGHKGHRVVNNGNVRLFLQGSSERLLAIACLGNDLPANAPFQHGAEPGPHRFMIVSYENPFHDRTISQCRTASGIDILSFAFQLPSVSTSRPPTIRAAGAFNVALQWIRDVPDGYDGVPAVALSWAEARAGALHITWCRGHLPLMKNGFRECHPSAAVWLSSPEFQPRMKSPWGPISLDRAAYHGHCRQPEA